MGAQFFEIILIFIIASSLGYLLTKATLRSLFWSVILIVCCMYLLSINKSYNEFRSSYIFILIAGSIGILLGMIFGGSKKKIDQQPQFKFRRKPLTKTERKNIQRWIKEAENTADEFGKVSDKTMNTPFNI